MYNANYHLDNANSIIASNDELFEALELINNRPLKIHDYRTAIEVFKARSE